MQTLFLLMVSCKSHMHFLQLFSSDGIVPNALSLLLSAAWSFLILKLSTKVLSSVIIFFRSRTSVWFILMVPIFCWSHFVHALPPTRFHYLSSYSSLNFFKRIIPEFFSLVDFHFLRVIYWHFTVIDSTGTIMFTWFSRSLVSYMGICIWVSSLIF